MRVLALVAVHQGDDRKQQQDHHGALGELDRCAGGDAFDDFRPGNDEPGADREGGDGPGLPQRCPQLPPPAARTRDTVRQRLQ